MAMLMSKITQFVSICLLWEFISLMSLLILSTSSPTQLLPLSLCQCCCLHPLLPLEPSCSGLWINVHFPYACFINCHNVHYLAKPCKSESLMDRQEVTVGEHSQAAVIQKEEAIASQDTLLTSLLGPPERWYCHSPESDSQ